MFKFLADRWYRRWVRKAQQFSRKELGVELEDIKTMDEFWERMQPHEKRRRRNFAIGMICVMICTFLIIVILMVV